MITHRIEDLKQCDNILVMQEGEIVQQGHFNQLKDQGFFAELLAQRKEGYSIMRALLPFYVYLNSPSCALF